MERKRKLAETFGSLTSLRKKDSKVNQIRLREFALTSKQASANMQTTFTRLHLRTYFVYFNSHVKFSCNYVVYQPVNLQFRRLNQGAQHLQRSKRLEINLNELQK